MATAVVSPKAVSPPRFAGLAREQLWKTMALAVFVTWLVVIGSRHEPWIDEAQAWLIARDSGLRELLFERVRYEGTPGLWHVILWVAIRCGLPYSLLFLIPTCFAALGAAVVLWRAPFPAWVRAAILGSYYFAYQYGVIARSYSVDLFLVPLAALFFRTRTTRPLRYAITVGLIANLNAHGFIAATAMGAELCVALFKAGRAQNIRNGAALLLLASMGLFALFCAWQPADNAFIREHRAPIPIIIAFVNQAFVNRVAIFSTEDVGRLEATLGFAITILALWPSLRLIARGSARWLALAVGGALLAFSGLTYASFWHSGLLYLFWIFSLWVSWPASGPVTRSLPVGLGVIAVAQLTAAIQTGSWDYRHVYSPAGAAAAFVADYRAAHPHASTAAFGYKTFAMQPYWPGNQFDNYKGGAAHPAWLDWRRGQTWDPFAARLAWLNLLAEKPDLIIASMSAVGRAPVPEGTCAAGYRVIRRFRGQMIWRGTEVEDDTILLLEHRNNPSDCAAAASSCAMCEAERR